MADDNTVPVRLQYVVEGQQAAIDSTIQVEKAVQSISDANTGVGSSAQDIDAVASYSSSSAKEVQNLSVNLRGATGELRALSMLAHQAGLSGIGEGARVASEVSRVVSSLPSFTSTIKSLGEAVTSTVSNVGTGVRNWVEGLTYFEGTIGEVGTVVSDALGPIGSMTIGIGALTAVAIPVAIAVVAVGAAMQTFNQIMEDGKKQLEAALSTEQAYFADEAKLTTQQAKEKMNGLQVQADEELKARNEAQAALQRSADQSKGVLPVGSLASKALFGDLYKNLDDAQKHLDDTNAAIGRLGGGLQSDAFAANSFTADLDKSIVSQKEYQTLISSATVADVNKRIREDQSQIDSYNDTLDRLKNGFEEGTISQSQYTQKQTEYEGKLRILIDDQSALSDTVLPTVIQRVKDLSSTFQTFDQVIQSTKDIYADMQKIAQDQAKYDGETAKITEDRRIRDSQQEADFQTAKTNKLLDHHTTVAQQDSDFYDGETAKLDKLTQTANASFSKVQAQTVKEAAQYAQQQKDNADKLAKDLQKINDTSRESELDAASRLDARSVARIERQKQEQIEQVADTYKTQKTISDRNEQEKLDTQTETAKAEHDKRITEGLATIQDEEKQYEIKKKREETKFQLDLKRADDAEQLKIDRQKAADIRQDDLRDKAFKAQEAALYRHLDSLLGIQTDGQGTMSASSGNFWGNVVATANNYFAGLKGPVATSPVQTQPTYTTSTTTQPVSNVNTYAPGEGFAYVNQANNYADLGGYGGNAGTSQLTAGGSIDIATQLAAENKASNYADLAGYRPPGYASGGEPPVNTPVEVAEGGKSEIAVFGERARILDGNSTARILDAIDNRGNTSTSRGGKHLTVNGPLIGTINGSNLNEQQLTAAVHAAVEDYVSKELDGLV